MPLFFSEHKLVDFDNWFATFENNEVRLEIEKNGCLSNQDNSLPRRTKSFNCRI